MFFVLSKVFEFLLMPLTWILFCLILGLIKRKSRQGHRFLFSGIMMLLFFTNPFILNKAIEAWEVPAYEIEKIRDPYEIGILLGGSLRYYNHQLERPVYSNSVDRMLQTIELYHSGKIKKVLVSGGSGRVLFPDEKEASLLVDVLKRSGVKQEDLILELDSRNTYENAVYSKRILDSISPGGDYLLITSAWHMRRSLGCFSKAGCEPDPYPVDERSGGGYHTPDRVIIPSTQGLVGWDMLMHEWAGSLMYRLMGYL